MRKIFISFAMGTILGVLLCLLFNTNLCVEKGAFVAGMIDRLIEEKEIRRDAVEGFIETPYFGGIAFQDKGRTLFAIAHKKETYPTLLMEHEDNTISIVFADGKDVTIKFDPSSRLADFLSITVDDGQIQKSFVDRGLIGKFSETFIFNADGSVERSLHDEN